MTTTADQITHLPQHEQFQAAPFGGVFRANKPVVGGSLPDGRSSAALFYLSHSRFESDFEFGLHHHEGFEIATFILEGSNSHYDTATRQWVELTAGDVQIIRSGSGISHNERVAGGSRAFQIWWDPGYRDALSRPPSYTDHPAHTFIPRTDGPATITDLIGGTGPVEAHTEGLRVLRLTLPAGESTHLDAPTDRFTLVYVIRGDARIDGTAITTNDAAVIEQDSPASVTATTGIELFVVSVPAQPSYRPVRQS